MSSIIPKPKAPTPPPPPPSAPTMADATVIAAGQSGRGSYDSFLSTGSQGLTRKAATGKTSLIGGN